MFDFPLDDDQHPKLVLERIMDEYPEFAEIKALEPKVAVIFRTVDRVKQNRMILGTCYIPTVQGELRGLFECLLEDRLGFWPDFLIVLSKPYWDAATPEQREILVFHEALHMGQEHDKYGTPKFNMQSGDPIFGIQGHDIEEFSAVVRRYGIHSPDVANFIQAANEGGAKRPG